MTLSDTRWQQFRRAFITTAPPFCALCGQWVDKTLPGTHRDGPTVDHITPRSRGGATIDRANCQLAHQRCNAAKRDGITTTTHSRTW